MKVEYRPVNELMPYARNPRRNDAAVNAVAASIKRFGFRNPIIVDKDGVVIAGHTRLKAAKQLNLLKVPVVRADDLTEEQAAAFRLADNKSQELSSWDFGLLMDELTSIKGIDMEEFGFSVASDEEEEKQVRRTQGARKSNLDDGYEVDLDDFSDETFACTCPELGRS